jgi:hypothetical protein
MHLTKQEKEQWAKINYNKEVVDTALSYMRIKLDTDEEKRKQHMTNFDLAEIPSYVLIRNLKRLGYKIRYFTTCKEFFASIK